MTKPTPAAQMVANVEAMIAETAYYKAAQRGFDPGHEVADWLAAEREVHAILSASEPLPARRRRTATASRAKATEATTKARTTKAQTTDAQTEGSTTKTSTPKAPRKARSRKAAVEGCTLASSKPE